MYKMPRSALTGSIMACRIECEFQDIYLRCADDVSYHDLMYTVTNKNYTEL